MNINCGGNRWHLHDQVATNFGSRGPNSIEVFEDEIQVEIEHNGDFLYYPIPIAVLEELIPKPEPEEICHYD